MKKIFISIATVLSLMTLNSCEDFLTVESPDQLTSSSFWRNKADAEAGLAAAYSKLESSTDVWGFAEIHWPVEAYREDIIEMGKDALNYQNWTELAFFNYNNGNSQFSLYWQDSYAGISYCNQVIEKVALIPGEAISEDDRNKIINEAYFLRAYYHTKLLMNWQDIIIRDKYITSQADLSKAISPRVECWDFVINDFARATGLPAQQPADNIGRATKGAAYAYLGWVYLTRAYEETARKDEFLNKAIDAFKNVQGYDLEKDFLSMFNGTNKNSKESIFELQFTMSNANGANYRTALHRWIGVSELWGWDEILPSESLVSEFMKEGKTASTGRYDSRLYASIFFQDEYFNDGTGKVYGYNYDDWFQDSKGVPYNRPAFRKFMPATYADLEMSRTGVNIPLMRYSNVLLMQAEALNESGRTAEAIPLINQVRERADMPAMTGTTQAAVREQIEHERILEFPLENFRFYDLRRWGKAKEALAAIGRNSFDPQKNNFYPVPLTEINSNDLVN
ncbi:MAG: RagB/SusD family nutrient uptake outer membrane protein [Bacteroidales bacterium]